MAGSIFFFSHGRELVIESGYLCEINPVKAGRVEYAWDYSWSSVHAHISGKDDFDLVETDKLLNLVGYWRSYLLESQSYSIEELESHERTGRPLGNERFIEVAESIPGRDLRKRKPGPKAKNDN